MKTRFTGKKCKICLAAIAAFVTVVAVGVFLTTKFDAYQYREKSLVLEQLSGIQALELKRGLDKAVTATYALAQLVRVNNGEFANFDRFADGLMTQAPEITNLQLAPNGVISQVYPLEGHESIIGFDVLRDENNRPEALKAVVSRKPTTTGPFSLKQGGVGIVVRHPVFTGEGQGKFWGFVTALLTVDHLVNASGLANIAPDQFLVSAGRRLDSGKTVQFYQNHDDQAEVHHWVEARMDAPDGEWYVRMAYPGVTINWIMLVGVMTSIILALITARLVYQVLKSPQSLRFWDAQRASSLERLAYYDHLTNLPNRLHMMQRVGEAIRAPEHDGSYYIMIVDVDRFEDINEVKGYSTGDQLLIDIADRITKVIPGSAEAGRFGADEFVVLVSFKDRSEAQQLAESLLQALSSDYEVDGVVISLTCTIGISILEAGIDTVQNSLTRAVQAVHGAKQDRRNSFRFYSEQLRETASRRKRLAFDITQAVKKQQMRLVYQPIISAETGDIVKVEALLRWHHPQMGELSPTEFIPVAEQNGSILEIGRWVLEEGVAQLDRWQKHNPNLQLSVNISPVQLRSDQHVAKVLGLLQRSPLLCPNIQLEITEGTLLENDTRVYSVMKNLSAQGVELAIDDFGTGYSSLSHLQNNSLSYLKIDRTFVSNLENSDQDRALCEGIILVAQRLGLSVVAEGVETRTQHELLINAGVDFLQGYLYSKPLDAEAFEKLLTGEKNGFGVFDTAA